MKLIFLRHGETDWNIIGKLQGSKDIPLNENGRKQAQITAQNLISNHIAPDVIISSKRSRASETARIIADVFHMEPEIREDLSEISFGHWEGKCFKDLPELFPEEYGNWLKNKRYAKIKGAETYDELLKRIMVALKDIVKKYEDKETILIITHGAYIGTLITHLNNPQWTDIDYNLIPDNLEYIELDAETIKKIF